MKKEKVGPLGTNDWSREFMVGSLDRIVPSGTREMPLAAFPTA
jgi:hypothetical protein